MRRIDKIINKISDTKDNVEEHFKKMNKNIRWEQRYNNLLKKYEKVCQDNKELEAKLDTDYNYQKALDYQRQIRRKNYIIENLQEENKKLMGGKDENIN